MASDISATYRIVATPPPPCDNTAVYFALSAYIIALLPHAFLGFSALGILCLLLALWRVVVQHRGKTAPSLDMTTVLGVAALVVLIGFGQMRLTPSTGVAALMVLLGCKNLVAKTPAQFTNNLLLLPFLPMGLFFTNDPPWASAYLLVFIVVWLSAMLRVWHPNDHSMIALRKGGVALATIAPLVLVSYFLLPRPHAWWSAEEQNASTGMSATLKPGDVGSLSQNEETAFLVKFKDGKIPLDYNRAYWRGLTLAEYHDGEWSRTRGPLQVPKEEPQEGIAYTVLFPTKKDRYIYSLERSTLPSIPQQYDGTAMLPRVENLQKFSTYEGIYYPHSPKITTPPLSSESSSIENDNPKTTALAKRLWAELPKKDATSFLLAWQQHVQSSKFIYSLQPGEMKTRWMDTFLERKQGFCEHYAGTTAYMLRQVGIPSRVVVGFQGARPYQDHTLDIPYSAAHAWLEYWNAASNEWVRLDPTGWVAPERLSAMHWERTDGYKPSTWWSQFGFLATSLDSQWKTWVTYYDADQQRELLRRISAVDWKPFGVATLGLIALGFVATGRRWLLLSPFAVHQREWLTHALNTSPSSAGVVIKQHLHQKNLPWFERLESRLYGGRPTQMLDFVEGWKVWVRLKSRTYRQNRNKV